MIRGKYLRERKAIRTRRRLKLLVVILILMLAYKILFNSYSLYESEANSTADIDVAFFLLKDEYFTKDIALEDMVPGGDPQKCEFSVSNYYLDDDGNEIVSETDMEYTLKIRTTTNLPLEYKLYMNQSSDSSDANDMIEINLTKDEDDTYFYKLVEDTREFSYEEGHTNTYTLVVSFPEEFKSIEYQNIIECIEISIDAHQIID